MELRHGRLACADGTDAVDEDPGWDPVFSEDPSLQDWRPGEDSVETRARPDR